MFEAFLLVSFVNKSLFRGNEQKQTINIFFFNEVVFLSMPSYIHISIDGMKGGHNFEGTIETAFARKSGVLYFRYSRTR